MDLNYSGSGMIVYNKNEYTCDLYINKNQGGILIKISVDNPIARFLELPVKIDFLNGELNTGYKFSLASCFRVKTENLLLSGKSIFSYQSRYLFQGVGGKGFDGIKLYKMGFQLSEIIEWGEITGYTVGVNHELLQKNDLTRNFFSDEKVSVQYVVNRDILPVHFTQLLKEEIILKQSGNIEISFKREEEIEKFESIFKKVKQLIEIATLKNVHLNKLTGWSKSVYIVHDEKRLEQAIDIISYDLKKDEKALSSRQDLGRWIPLPELFRNNSFNKYFLKYELLEPIIDLYLEILESTEMSAVRVFLNVVQALETYHSRFITNDIEKFKQRVELEILKERPSAFLQKGREFLMANSHKYITLESRLADLLFAKFEMIFDTGNIKFLDFPNVIAKTRNYYIHYDETIKIKGRVLTEEELSIYNRALFCILDYYFLLELGFSDAKQIQKKLYERWGSASQDLSLIKL